MKKKIKYLMLVVMVLTFFTGCKSEYTMTIKKNKDIEFGYIVALSKNTLNSMLSMADDTTTSGVVEDEDESDYSEIITDGSSEVKEFTDKEHWEYLEKNVLPMYSGIEGVKYEKYTEGDYKGYTFKVSLGNIDNYTKTSDRVSIADILTSYKDGLALFTKDGNKYVSNMKYENSSEDTQSLTTKFIVKLPSKAKSHNAGETKDSGKTLIWTLSSEKNIDFEFSFNSNMMTYAIIGGVAVLVIAGVVFVLNSRKKIVE